MLMNIGKCKLFFLNTLVFVLIFFLGSNLYAKEVVKKNEQIIAPQISKAQNNASSQNRFKLLWHIGPQIEDLADPSAEYNKIIESTKNIVDGYYFLFMNGGFLRYWPGREPECALNYHAIETRNIESPLKGKVVNTANARSFETNCESKYEAYLESKRSRREDINALGNKIQEDAISRVLKTLSLPENNISKHKIVVVPLVLNNRNFQRKKNKLPLSVVKLPWYIEQLSKNNVDADYFMAYQEPGRQKKKDAVLYSCKNKIWCTTLDKDILQELHRALLESSSNSVHKTKPNFAQAKYLVDIRRWYPEHQIAYKVPGINDPLQGILFEGGVGAMSKPKPGKESNFATFAPGAVWLLKNTAQKIFFLIPNHLPQDKLDSELVSSITNYVVELNNNMRKEMGGSAEINPVCNERIYFVPAGYGAPTHLRQLPDIKKTGSNPGNMENIAGTVTGELKALDELRNRLCFSSR